MSESLPKLRLRLVFGPGDMLGPGKVELLSLIGETGSIAGAGRRMKMSYKRAWQLVETLNAMFSQPLVESSRGGAGHGGAQLTPAGVEVLRLYREMTRKTAETIADEVSALAALRPENAEPDNRDRG